MAEVKSWLGELFRGLEEFFLSLCREVLMAAVIRILEDVEATLVDGKWTCPAAPELEPYLESLSRRFGIEPGGESPQPERDLASAVAEHLGGELLSADLIDAEPGAVY